MEGDQVKLIEPPHDEPKEPVPIRKKPLSAFSLFLKHYKETVGKATLTDVAQKWGQLSEEEKAPFKKTAEEEKAKYVSPLRLYLV